MGLGDILGKMGFFNVGGVDNYKVSQFVAEQDARTQADKINAEMKRQYEENLKMQRELKKEELEYNSPKNAVARMREAGLNPYWANISAGEYGSALSAPDYSTVMPDKVQNPIAQSFDETVKELSSVVGLITNTVTAMSLLDDIGADKQKQIDNSIKTNLDIQNKDLDRQRKLRDLNIPAPAPKPQPSTFDKAVDAIDNVLGVVNDISRVGINFKRLTTRRNVPSRYKKNPKITR